MSTPRYAEFYDMPEVDSLYDRDPAYTRRCEQVGAQLCKVLCNEVRPLLQLPSDLLNPTVWELSHCIWDRIYEVCDLFEGEFEGTSRAHARDLLKLSRWLVRYGLASEPARRALNRMYAYVRNGVGGELMGVAA